MAKYRFEQIAINSKEKKKPAEESASHSSKNRRCSWPYQPKHEKVFL